MISVDKQKWLSIFNVRKDWKDWCRSTSMDLIRSFVPDQCIYSSESITCKSTDWHERSNVGDWLTRWTIDSDIIFDRRARENETMWKNSICRRRRMLFKSNISSRFSLWSNCRTKITAEMKMREQANERSEEGEREREKEEIKALFFMAVRVILSLSLSLSLCLSSRWERSAAHIALVSFLLLLRLLVLLLLSPWESFVYAVFIITTIERFGRSWLKSSQL